MCIQLISDISKLLIQLMPARGSSCEAMVSGKSGSGTNDRILVSQHSWSSRDLGLEGLKVQSSITPFMISLDVFISYIHHPTENVLKMVSFI